MPDLLSPTNSVPRPENTPLRSSGSVNSTPSTVQNVVDPSRVMSPDRRTEQQDAGALRWRYESNYLSFVQKLRESPALSQSFARLLLGKEFLVCSGISPGLAKELSGFLDFLNINEGQLSAFLQEQLKSSSRFSGAFFQALRSAYIGARSELLKTEILRFLRQYSDYSSTLFLQNKITRTLYDISSALPKSTAEQMLMLGARFENGAAAGDRAGNLQLLREQVFPLIAAYVTRSHDHGRARSLLSTLTLDMIRYENGGEQELLRSFRQLCQDTAFPKELSQLADADILRLLEETDHGRAARSDRFAQQLSEMTSQALRGESGVHAQEVFRNIMNAVLLHQSVYMPLRHVILPFTLSGKSVYSELWLHPDAEQGSQSGEPPILRVLIKMDIADWGTFDLLLNAQGKNTALSIYGPPTVTPYAKQIVQRLGDILTQNGLVPGSIQVASMDRPLRLSEVFPKLFEEAAHGVDVQI